MSIELATISLLNGLSYGLLLFMLSSGLTLIFGMMGVLNFAHASFYMLGAYFAYALGQSIGFWPALVIAPLLAAGLGALVERFGLRRVHRWGQVAELLLTFGLALMIDELVQIVWGRAAVPYHLPESLRDTAFTIFGAHYPAYRVLMMGVAVCMLVVVWLALTRTRIGLVIQASLTHPDAVQALGHNVPRVFMLVFAGGCALAGLAGAIGGSVFLTEPSMAQMVGPIIFVVIVLGGLGSLAGAFLASLLIGILQTFALAIDGSLASLLAGFGWALDSGSALYPVWSLKLSQVAPVLPYLLMVAMLVLRPRGLMGTREG